MNMQNGDMAWPRSPVPRVKHEQQQEDERTRSPPRPASRASTSHGSGPWPARSGGFGTVRTSRSQHEARAQRVRILTRDGPTPSISGALAVKSRVLDAQKICHVAGHRSVLRHKF